MKEQSSMVKVTYCAKICLVGLALALAQNSGGVQAAESTALKGKTVRIIVPFSAGGGNDVTSRVLARAMSKYTPGKPAIIVENMTGAGGRIGVNYVYKIAKPDGTAILSAMSSAAIHQLVGTKGVGYDLAKFEYLGNLGPIIHVFVVNSKLPIKTVDDLNKLGRPLAIGGGSSSSTSTVIGRILQREKYNVEVTKGYRGESGRYKALLTGEVDAALMGAHMLEQDKENLRPILWIKYKMAKWKNVPNLEDLSLSKGTASFIKAITIPSQYGRAYLAPPNTPKEPLGALRKGFKLAVEDPKFVRDAAKVGIQVVEYRGPEETKAEYLKVFETPPAAVEELKGVLGLKR
jgi:tripartite-type tricarboxylate transporter receptor subunit TctC